MILLAFVFIFAAGVLIGRLSIKLGETIRQVDDGGDLNDRD